MSNKNIEEENYIELLADKFLNYSFSVTLGRAIPDIHDGLKPVQRRILYSAHESGFHYDKPFKKAAKLVGNVLGSYHAKGDTAVYDAAIRMSQEWKMNVALIEPQGNNGSCLGDSAAAMRYVELRMSKPAKNFFNDIGKESVDWIPNYDSSTVEPVLLPVSFPNLLINGASGMAVGYASSIPPHNPYTTIQATKALLTNPNISEEDVIGIMGCPDFPSGGTIINSSAILDMYTNGKGGSIIIRGNATISGNEIHVTNLPYLVSGDGLREEIVTKLKDERLQGITNITDSTTHKNGEPTYTTDIVITVKRGFDPKRVLQDLFNGTRLQSTYNILMNCVMNGKIVSTTPRKALLEFINFRKSVIRKKYSSRLMMLRNKSHLLDGLLKALPVMQTVIKIIEKSSDEKDAISNLMKHIKLSFKQGESIVNMKLSKLTSLGKKSIHSAKLEVDAEIITILKIIASDKEISKIIRAELDDFITSNKIKEERRTLCMDIDTSNINIPEGKSIVVLTGGGNIKRFNSDLYNAQKRGGKGKNISVGKNDSIHSIIHGDNQSVLFYLSNTGRIFSTKLGVIPEIDPDRIGLCISNIIDLQDGEKIVSLVEINDSVDFLLILTKQGIIKKTKIKDFVNIRKHGLICVKFKSDSDEIVSACGISSGDDVLVGANTGLCSRYTEEDITETGRSSMGVAAMNIPDGVEMVSLEVVSTDFILTINRNGMGKRTEARQFGRTNRNVKGYIAQSMRDGDLLCCATPISPNEDIFIITGKNKTIRIPYEEISQTNRRTYGSKIIDLSKDDYVRNIIKI